MGVERQGMQHQAGSDSLVTLKLFWSLKTGGYKNDINLKEVFMVFGMDSESEYSQDSFFQQFNQQFLPEPT